MMRAGANFFHFAIWQMHRGGRIGGNRDVEDQFAAFAFPRADDPAARMLVARADPVERLAVGIAGCARDVRRDDDLLEARSMCVDASERLETPLHHRAKGVMRKAIHRRIVLTRRAVEAVLLREGVPAFPHARRTLLDFVAPRGKFAALEKAAREIVLFGVTLFL